MTPEELKEFREWCRTFEVPADSMITKALTHIDQQATSLAATEERVREHEAHENQTHEVLGKILGTDDTLENVARRAVDRIKELEVQVAALQEIAGEERVRLIARCVHDCPEGGCLVDEERISETVESIGEDLKEQARRQLSEEHPEAFR